MAKVNRSAIKRVKQAEKRRRRNASIKSAVKTAIKHATRAIEARQDLELAKGLVSHAFKLLDKAAAKGVIHKNSAARRKSRLLRRLHSLFLGTT